MNVRQENSRHWGDDELLDRLYGLAPAPGFDAAHLESCPVCADRWTALATSRAALLAAAPPATLALDARLRVQRSAIWNRIERPVQHFLARLAPVAATALMIVVGVALHQVQPPAPPVQIAAISDDQLFSDIATVVSQETPAAAEPIRALFAATQSTEAQ